MKRSFAEATGAAEIQESNVERHQDKILRYLDDATKLEPDNCGMEAIEEANDDVISTSDGAEVGIVCLLVYIINILYITISEISYLLIFLKFFPFRS